MAVVKAVSSRASISQAIDYVTKREKTDERLLTGQGCEPDTAREEMQSTKELWGKTGGRTYKHFVQSFAPGERITTEQAHTLACEFARNIPEWKGFEVLIATHKDKKAMESQAQRVERSQERFFAFNTWQARIFWFGWVCNIFTLILLIFVVLTK